MSFGTQFGIMLSALAVVAGLAYRIRIKRLREAEATALSDDMIRQIEHDGWVDVDDPLDLETIQEEEARFLEEEPWDEADEW